MERKPGVKQLGITELDYLRPMFYTWLPGQAPGTVTPAHQTINDIPGILTATLRQGHLDAAFLSPIDFANLHKECCIIPQLGVLSAGESGVITVLFRDHLRDIKSVAFAPNAFSAEVVLAHIVLAEKYELHPKFIPITGGIDDALRSADAVILSGNRVTGPAAAGHSRIDLVDEWMDIAELPYVHGFWLARDGAFPPAELKEFISASEQGVRTYHAPDEEQEEWLAEHFAYALHEDALAGLNEFLRMAFYHGILKEIIEPRFHSLKK